MPDVAGVYLPARAIGAVAGRAALLSQKNKVPDYSGRRIPIL